jgi:hypothetical protein
MKPRRRFLIALMASLALHLGVLTSPAWRLPLFDDQPSGAEPAIEARLVAPVARPGATPLAPRPKPRPRKPRRAAPAVLPLPAAPATAVPADPAPAVAERAAPVEPVEPVAAPAALAPAAPAPAEIALPRRVRIRYRVTLGQHGFVIGETIQELRHDGAGYEMRSTARTTGLAGFFKPVQVVNVSQGEVVDGGLRPNEFRIERSTGGTDSAHFDWQAMRVTLSNQRSFPLAPGAQDMLSMFGELAMLPLDGATVALPVVTGKKVERYEFAVLGAETLATPRGERPTLHLRSGQVDDKESTDVWLGLDDARLPVKIRYVDRRRDVYEQIAESIEFDMKTEGAP